LRGKGEKRKKKRCGGEYVLKKELSPQAVPQSTLLIYRLISNVRPSLNKVQK
jgi:hypothetical protein